MSDRELLEKAARAAGLKPEDAMWHPRAGLVWVKRVDGIRTENAWNPLQDDADEARLEASLSMDVIWQSQHVIVGPKNSMYQWQEPYHLHGGDKQKARRYAGVRAAAAIHDAKGQHDQN